LVVQLVRIHACHAWGRGFESHPDRQKFFKNNYKKIWIIKKESLLLYQQKRNQKDSFVERNPNEDFKNLKYDTINDWRL
jgi:hypothetical protein